MNIISSVSSAVYNYAVVPAASLAVAEGVRQIGKALFPAALSDRLTPVANDEEAEAMFQLYQNTTHIRQAVGVGMFVAGVTIATMSTSSKAAIITPVILNGLYGFTIAMNPTLTLRHIIFDL